MKKYLSIISISLLTVYLCTSCKSDNEETLIWTEPPTAADTLYQNPLFEPDLADPSFVRGTDGWFYAYGTENDWASGLTRLTPIVKSKNLTKWQYDNDAFTVKPDWHNGGLWAPCMVYREGTYYLYYSLSQWGDSNPGVGLATSTLPYGPFADQGKVLDSQSIGVANSIDPFFIEVVSGRNKKRYLFWGSYRGIYGIEISTDMKTLIGQKFKIAGDAFEATYIYPKNGKFYFFGSNGNCCEGADSKYRLSVAVADNVTGPYYTRDGKAIINNGQEGTPFLHGDASVGWVGPGHNAEIITDDNGHDFMLYHAIDIKNPLLPNGATRRPLMMDEVHWDSADGWPYIEGNVPSNKLKRAPYFAPSTAETN